jgi:type IV pilus assembly protein PilW
MSRRGPLRARGFSLVELMIALALSSLVAAGVLILVRSQLAAFELNDSVMKTQQNARAGIEFVESQLRRACVGISEGALAIDVPGITPVGTRSCVQFFDSAALSGGTFTTSGSTSPDAIEIVYGAANSSGSYTVASVVSGFSSTTPQVTVTDMTGFSVGDYVLVTNFKRADLLKIATINGGAVPATGPGPLTFGTLSANAVSPAGYTPAAGDAVMKATTISIYRGVGFGSTPAQLFFDPDGMVGADHTDAQPLVEGVADFQLAFGLDWQAAAPANGTQNDGLITEGPVAGRAANDDEWIGNFAGEVLPAAPWNPTPAAAPMLLQIRTTLVLRTLNVYKEPIANLGPFEDGAAVTALDAAGGYPRYRTMRTVVAPRVWNLGE